MSLARAIGHLIPNAEFILVGDDYETLVWEGPGEKPAEAVLRAAEAEADAAAAVDRVQRLRKAAFAAEADPLFFAWQAGEGTKEAWEAKRDEIKQRFPLP